MSAQDTRLAELQQRIGHVFADRDLLREALTHASALDGAPELKSYERLEFMGDRVLGLIMAEKLLADFPSQDEKGLAPRFNALVWWLFLALGVANTEPQLKRFLMESYRHSYFLHFAGAAHLMPLLAASV